VTLHKQAERPRAVDDTAAYHAALFRRSTGGDVTEFWLFTLHFAAYSDGAFDKAKFIQQAGAYRRDGGLGLKLATIYDRIRGLTNLGHWREDEAGCYVASPLDAGEAEADRFQKTGNDPPADPEVVAFRGNFEGQDNSTAFQKTGNDSPGTYHRTTVPPVPSESACAAVPTVPVRTPTFQKTGNEAPAAEQPRERERPSEGGNETSAPDVLASIVGRAYHWHKKIGDPKVFLWQVIVPSLLVLENRVAELEVAELIEFCKGRQKPGATFSGAIRSKLPPDVQGQEIAYGRRRFRELGIKWEASWSSPQGP